jgi:hypothetical protein
LILLFLALSHLPAVDPHGARLLSLLQKNNVQIEWFGAEQCQGNNATKVEIRAGECNVVPGGPFSSTYKVTCNEDDNGGVASYCSDQVCGTCVTQSFNDNECVATNPAFGSSSAKFDCQEGSGDNDPNGASEVTLGAVAVAGLAAAAAGIMQW